MDKHDSGITRRRLRSHRRLAGASAMGGFTPAWAQSGGRVVVGVGRRLLKLLAKNIDTPLLVPKKYSRARYRRRFGTSREDARQARLPRGTSDLQGLSAPQMLKSSRTVPPRRLRQIPNAQYLLTQMRYPYGVGHIYSGKVILYIRSSHAPHSFADAIDRSTATSSASSTFSIRTR
jgi:putative spermidine/putrescine transport system substrate-binding protein